MTFLRLTLWRQLVTLWGVTIFLAALLTWYDTRRPFFWLVPYPTWRMIRPMIVEFFHVRPILATAMIGLPALALLASIALCILRLRPELMRAMRTS
jgi:hypothetical protein